MTLKNGTTPHGGEPHKDAPLLLKNRESDRAVLLGEKDDENFASPTQFAGYALQDPLGRVIGKIEKLFVNGHGGPEYIAVRIVSFWQNKSVLIPVDFFSVNDERRTLVLR